MTVCPSTKPFRWSSEGIPKPGGVDNEKSPLKSPPRQIQLRFVDRVLPNVGLCIEFYNFVSIKAASLPSELKSRKPGLGLTVLNP